MSWCTNLYANFTFVVLGVDGVGGLGLSVDGVGASGVCVDGLGGSGSLGCGDGGDKGDAGKDVKEVSKGVVSEFYYGERY